MTIRIAREINGSLLDQVAHCLSNMLARTRRTIHAKIPHGTAYTESGTCFSKDPTSYF